MDENLKLILPDYISLIKEYKTLRNKTRRILTKINSLEKKYYFLNRIIEPRKKDDTKENDTELEVAVFDLFKSLNFNCEKPLKNEEVDVKIKFKDYYYGIEVKNGNYVSENDTMQAYKHKILNNETYHPIILYNNTLTKANWDNPRIKIALKNNFGLLLTTELLKGYSMLKANKISFTDFLFMLSQSGEIKFGKRALDRAYKSDISR